MITIKFENTIKGCRYEQVIIEKQQLEELQHENAITLIQRYTDINLPPLYKTWYLYAIAEYPESVPIGFNPFDPQIRCKYEKEIPTIF